MATITQGHEVIGTGIFVRTAWEPKDGHTTIKTIDGVWMGQIGTRKLPADLDAMPSGAERIEAVMAWYANQYEEAYIAIGHNCPQAKKTMGQVDCPHPIVTIPATLAVH